MASLQGIFDLAMQIPIGNGILFSSLSKIQETKMLILRPSKFSTCPGTLPSHGAIPSLAPLGRGHRGEHPEASISLPILALGSASNALVAPPSSSSTSSQAESNCSRSGLSGWAPNKVGHCTKAGSSKFISRSCCFMTGHALPPG